MKAAIATALGMVALAVACSGGVGNTLGIPDDNTPPNDSEHAGSNSENPGSSTDPAGSSTDPAGNSCIPCSGNFNCVDQTITPHTTPITLSKDGSKCSAGDGVEFDPCTGVVTYNGTVVPGASVTLVGGGLQVCAPDNNGKTSCNTCTPGPATVTNSFDASLPDTSIPQFDANFGFDANLFNPDAG